MRTYRLALDSASIVLAVLIAGACGQINQVVRGRDLECGEAPEDLCVRMADHIANDFERLNPTLGSVVKVTVWRHDSHDCPPESRRTCWLVHADGRPNAAGLAGAGRMAVYYQREDGTLVALPDELVGG